MAGVLHIDPAARGVAAGVAAHAHEAPPSSPVVASALNAFDVANGLVVGWAAAVHASVSAAVSGRGIAVGDRSAAGFRALGAMNAQNTISLGTVVKDVVGL
jgi:hypothetical protein